MTLPAPARLSLAHNSRTAPSEPAWTSVDKTKLPKQAFALRSGSKADWKYPHHWVKGGSEQNDEGIYTNGTLYLHRGGLDAAWAAAHGARSGKSAPASVIAHLQQHRNAAAAQEADTSPVTTDTGRVLLHPHVTGPRRQYDCIFVQPGRVLQADGQESNWLLPEETLRPATPLFNAASVYLDHPSRYGFGFRDEPKVTNLAGVTANARWSEAERAIVGTIRLYDQEPGSPGALAGALFDQILADKAAGREVPPIGLSAGFFHRSHYDEDQDLKITDEIAHVISVDLVYSPGARGYVRAALSATIDLPPPGETAMPEDRTTQTPAPHPAPVPAAPPPHSESEPTPVPAGPAPDPVAPAQPDLLAQLATLEEHVSNLAQQQAALVEATTISGMGEAPRSAPLYGGRSTIERVELALDALISGTRPPDDIAPLTGIRELYHLLSGDFEMTGVYRPERVYLANVNSSTMAALVANRLNKRVVTLFQDYPQWWIPIVTSEDFATLQDVRWITLGGIGELPTVNAGAAYTELTWDDNTETASFVKKGGYLGITIEAIDKDDTGRLRAAPRALAQAAWLTLSKAISAIFTANSGTGPTLADTNNLFDATNHGNLGSTALSFAAWQATRLAMRKQTELNSGERLGALVAPKFLLVPPDLEITALQIFASQGEPGTADNDENPFAQGNEHDARLNAARSRVIVVDLWSDTNNWAAVANPQLYPSIGLAFRYGRSPEIFSVASPTAGLMFSNDTMPIKVRFFFATGPTDYRGLYKHNVS